MSDKITNYTMKYILIFTLMIMGKIYPTNKEKIDVDITMGKYGSISQNSVGKLEIFLYVKNLNSKTIKYMTTEILAQNNVGDIIYPNIGDNNCKITGPINQGQEFPTKGCTSYYDSEISKVMVRITKVEYMDGTKNNVPSDYFIFDKEELSKERESFYKKEQDEYVKGMIYSVIIGVLLSMFVL